MRLGGRVEVDRGKGQTGTVLSHESTLSGSINESGSRSGWADGWHDDWWREEAV